MYTDLLTIHAAAKLFGLPLSILHQAILGGTLTARTVCGEALVDRSEVTAMAIRMRLKSCENCDD